MRYESLKDSPPISALKDLFSDVSDLLRKEIRLAKAEISAKVSAGVAAGIWMRYQGKASRMLQSCHYDIKRIAAGMASEHDCAPATQAPQLAPCGLRIVMRSADRARRGQSRALAR